MLCSYYLKFDFKTDSGILNYLNGKIFTLDCPFTIKKRIIKNA